MNSKIVNIMGLVASVTIFFILASSMVKSYKRIQTGEAVVAKTKIKIQKAEEETKKLSEQLEVIQSEEFMEKQLRDKLGLAREGEIILVLPEADIVRKLSPQVPEEETIKPKTNIEKWLDLFI